MGQTASTIYRRYSPCALPIYRLLICGISASGKTSILYRLALPDKEGMLDVIPTIGFNIETFRGDAAELTGWDLGGREKTRPLWRHYFEGSDAIVFVVDSSDRYTIDESRDEFRRLTSEEETRKLPVLLLCNKQDLPNAMTPEEVMEAFGLDAKSMEERPILVHGCSAKTNDGLDESINLLADCLVEAKAFGATKSIQHSLDDSLTRTDESTSTLSHSSLDTSVNVSRQNETLQNFSRIKKSTECPFAKRAKLWGGLVSAEAFSIEAQAASHIPPLIEFCERLAESESLDGFCIEIDDEVAAKGGPEEFGQCVRRMLSELSVNDPAGENVMAAKYIDRPGWRYRFHSTDFFVTTFAPCYSEISSRYGFGSDKAFILLQPESSFLRHKLPPDSAETDWNNPRNIREKTRVAFKNAGRPYYIPETTSYPIVEHIVKPICDDGKNVVRWWTEQ
ncbi:unnamed protein product [Cylindrotheca closterium]|uniref:ADP-ribosylation factor n=1 Tax=Cylindrotheca closterium TaxID=2856 RepID=A0AAD2FI87_9STRA|nr:unnamed protein product [Cylindrotheca closterium]